MTTPIRLLGPLLLCLVLFQNCTLLEELESLNPLQNDITVSVPAREILYTVPASEETGPYTFRETVETDLKQDMHNLGYSTDLLDGATAHVKSVRMEILTSSPSVRTYDIKNAVLRVRSRNTDVDVDLTKGDVEILDGKTALLDVNDDLDIIPYLMGPRLTYAFTVLLKDEEQTVGAPVDIRLLPEVVIVLAPTAG